MCLILTGNDAEIFNQDLIRELTEEEKEKVKQWAMLIKSAFELYNE